MWRRLKADAAADKAYAIGTFIVVGIITIVLVMYTITTFYVMLGNFHLQYIASRGVVTLMVILETLIAFALGVGIYLYRRFNDEFMDRFK